jgi:ABC-type multidrug transport system permease subunit
MPVPVRCTTCPRCLLQVLASALNMIFSLFCGFVITYPTMPDYWKWLNRISPSTWLVYGLGVSQLGNVEVGPHAALLATCACCAAASLPLLAGLHA